MTALELHDVSKVYGDGPTEVHALRDVCLSAAAVARLRPKRERG